MQLLTSQVAAVYLYVCIYIDGRYADMVSTDSCVREGSADSLVEATSSQGVSEKAGSPEPAQRMSMEAICRHTLLLKTDTARYLRWA